MAKTTKTSGGVEMAPAKEVEFTTGMPFTKARAVPVDGVVVEEGVAEAPVVETWPIVEGESRVVAVKLVETRPYNGSQASPENNRREGATGVVLTVSGPRENDRPEDELLTVRHDDGADKLIACYLRRECEPL